MKPSASGYLARMAASLGDRCLALFYPRRLQCDCNAGSDAPARFRRAARSPLNLVYEARP